MTNELMNQARIVDMNDNDLKNFLLYSHEAVKNLEEQKKNDPVLAELQEKVSVYVDETYAVEIKFQKANLKAARSLAKARGIEIKLPGDNP